MARDDQDRDHADIDTADLRAQLALAQERLATYQKFDRDIAENVRRSSELMLEAMQVRERMDHEATTQARARQERLLARLGSLQTDLEGVQGQVGSMLERVASLRDEIESESPTGQDDEPAAESATVEDVVTPSDADAADAAASDSATEESAEPAAPRTVELIAHGMTRAASALALQSHLRAQPQVETVDAREFSSGILRLQLTIVSDLSDEDLLGWEGDDDITITRHQDDAIELRIGE